MHTAAAFADPWRFEANPEVYVLVVSSWARTCTWFATSGPVRFARASRW
jgi:hypothetical protein